jgi:5-methylcytosine-specific restriction endonuclease McrA
MANTKKRSGNTGRSEAGVPKNLKDDKRAWGLVKLAIRKAWQWSNEYKELINSADYTCQHCGKRYTNKSKLYVEHIESLALKDVNTAEELWVAMRDMTNIQVWCKECKPVKDKLDRMLWRAHKNGKSKV